ncbi:unnamed protein product [Strongylus vulgaris]|uniref:Uncharacterized protein n=1 Tax=Strongylus vulgaris TaxID=40348 RepID=A0A3P7JZS4_STRVU|nr:unnamed protein product [Strongylus vulgaris]
MQADHLRKKLNFDDEEGISEQLTPTEDERINDEDDDFEDACETFDENILNDSLASLADRLGALSLRSPPVEIRSKERFMRVLLGCFVSFVMSRLGKFLRFLAHSRQHRHISA